MKIEINQFGKNIFNVEIEDFNILEGNPIFIGRSEKSHIHLDDQKLSRQHAKIYYDKSSLKIESLSAHKKIELNGNEVSKSELGLQDKIIIGNYILIITEWDYQINRREDEDGLEKTEVLNENDKTEILDNDKTDILETPEKIEEIKQDLENMSPNSDVDETEPFNSDEGLSVNKDVEESALENDQFDNDFSNDSFEENDGFEENGGFEEGFSDEDSTKVFKAFADFSLKLKGKFAPFDRYAIEDNEVLIGRNEEKCQILLNDPEVSGIHSCIKKSLINITIEDKDSSNGTLVNGERINKVELKVGDIIQIGSTQFEVELKSELIESEQDILMPVDDNQVVEIEEIVEEEVDFGAEGSFTETAPSEKGLKGIWKDPQKRKKLIYGGVILMGLWLFLDEEPSPEKSGPKKTDKTTKAKKAEEKKIPLSKKHSPETLERLEENYTIALAKYEAGEYYEAKEYLDIVFNIDSEYKDVKTLLELVKQGYEEILRLKAAQEAEKERKKRQLEVKKLMVKVNKAVKEKNVKVAEALFAKVLEIDPENIDIPQLKIEIEAYKEKQKQKRLEESRKKALRQSMLDALAPGKNLFLKQKWYESIINLEKFNNKKAMDEDLVKEATEMIVEAKKNLNTILSPLLGRARSYKEGQDFKRAYETYGEVLKNDPSNEEALNERDSILERLNNNSKKIYREALISESLSLFSEAKEKFQQVQQISPINSEYYLKATEKLKNYLD